MNTWRLNLNAATKPLDHFWELCVGSCHAATALREDYRAQLRQASHDCGFRYVRFHGLFDDDMSVLTGAGMVMSREGGQEYTLSFTNIDSVFDFLLSIGMRPFVELGFMPKVLTSGQTTIFHYEGHTAPPDDFGKWQWLVEEFTRHCVQRYGLGEVRQWFFEVWNEPNLGGKGAPMGFWGGDQADYFHLYEAAARGVKAVDSRLRVGGPATADNSWVPELIDYCRAHQVPLDFITTHNYPTDLGSGSRHGTANLMGLAQREDIPAEERKKMVEAYLSARESLWSRIPRGILTEWARTTAEEAQGLPVYYTEWHSSGGLESDGPFGASFIAKTCLDLNGIVQGYSYWTFTDLFEEGGMPHTPFHGGFGLLNLQGIPKASYRAFQLLHQLGGTIYEEVYSSGTVDIYAVRHEAAHAVQLLAVNHQSLQQPVEAQQLSLTLEGLQNGCAAATVQRVDADHGNALGKWQELGCPDYPDQGVIDLLKGASFTRTEALPFECDGDSVRVELTVPAQGIALVTLYL